MGKENESPNKAKKSSSKSKHKGKPVRIIEIVEEEDYFKLNEKALKKILHKVPEDMSISVISVVGAFRTGKSFLLDMMLRYLNHTEGDFDLIDEFNEAKEPKEDWLKSDLLAGNLNSQESTNADSMAKGGFGWRSGKDRCTTGIWMWSEFFIRKLPDSNEKVAVLLVDTQGMFDSTLGQGLTAAIFGLSTLISSYQVYNLDKRVQEDNLQHLALFTEYGRVALQEEKKRSNSKSAAASGNEWESDAKEAGERTGDGIRPFQRLELLVRDWQNFSDEDGDLETITEDMRDYLKEVLDEREQKDLKQVREQIHDCFEVISCFLLPHPGLDVPKRNYNGEISKIMPSFRRLLSEYLRRMFSSRLVVKKIHGRAVSAKELYLFMQVYANLFKEGTIFPEAKTLLAATSEANNRAAVDQSIKVFRAVMDPLLGPNKAFCEDANKMKDQFKIAKDSAHEKYYSIATLGPKSDIEDYRKMLDKEISTKQSEYEEANKLRDPFGFVQIFILPLIIAIASYVIRMILDFFCTSWSSTCATGSDFLSMVYITIFSFIAIHLLSTGHGVQSRVKKLFEMAVASQK